jgi:hypothetical protein
MFDDEILIVNRLTIVWHLNLNCSPCFMVKYYALTILDG